MQMERKSQQCTNMILSRVILISIRLWFNSMYESQCINWYVHSNAHSGAQHSLQELWNKYKIKNSLWVLTVTSSHFSVQFCKFKERMSDVWTFRNVYFLNILKRVKFVAWIVVLTKSVLVSFSLTVFTIISKSISNSDFWAERPTTSRNMKHVLVFIALFFNLSWSCKVVVML